MIKIENLCIKWLNEKFNHMEPFIMEEYPDFIFHMKDGKCILQYNKKTGYVYVSYGEIWSFFESFFSMSYQQIKDITKIWVEEHYKMGVITTFKSLVCRAKRVEEHYKMRVITTATNFAVIVSLVEEHYKMRVITTPTNSECSCSMVEEHYKMRVITTDDKNLVTTAMVEEHYKMGVITTERQRGNVNVKVEEHYKMGVTTIEQ